MKNTIVYYCLLSLALFYCSPKKEQSAQSVESLGLIPAAASVNLTKDSFVFDETTEIAAQGDNNEVVQLATYLSSEVESLLKLKLKTIANAAPDKNNVLFLTIDNQIENKEGYSVTVNSKQINIKAKNPQGLFYGVQTILQLLYPQQNATDKVSISGVEIKDAPVFAWRGMHMDVCRHFYSVEFVKKMIDAMAMLKMNTFHWHLTDDQGWRIEIKKYPKLTEISAWRSETVVGHMADHPYKYDGTKHGGFYTQEQIRDVVAYAKSKYITVVPEIEMPGHAVAALSAYPEYSCTGGPFEVYKLWGVSDDVYCAGKEKTFQFMEDILSEVMDLFPSEYIHIGGDECPKVRWKKCPDCQKRIKAEGLKDEEALQGYFTKRMEKFLSSKGRKLIGWDEILDGGALPPSATVMSWRGTEGGITASKANHDVVMTPGAFCYFDHYQDRAEHEPIAIAGYKPLSKVYSYNPIPEELTKEEAKHILGAQANVWTEYITTEKYFEYMVFPRLCAMAEILWTPRDKQNYPQFLERMDKQYARLDAKNINYRVAMPEGFEADNKFLTDTTTINLTCEIPSAEIRYTLDGSEPSKGSKLYESPFVLQLASAQTLKAKTFMTNGKTSTTRIGTFVHAPLQKDTTLTNPSKGIVFNYYKKEFTSAKIISGIPTRSSITSTIAIPDSIKKLEWFGAVFNGFIQINEDGIYSFHLNADDGAVLSIDGQLLIDNDGYHYGSVKSGQAALKKGYHSIEVKYFQGKFGVELDVKMNKKGEEEKEISQDILWH